MTSLEKWCAAHPVKYMRDMLARWTCLQKFNHYRPRPKDWRDGYEGPLVLPHRVHRPCKVSLDAWNAIFTESSRTSGLMVSRPRLLWSTYQQNRRG